MNDTSKNDEQLPMVSKFPIVGIGASAGGLDAFEKFFTNMPPNSGMAFVLVQHLDPNHDSMLVDLIRRYTRMSVLQVTNALTIRPNHVYIIPPNKDLAILNGELHLMEPEAPRGFRLPIDFFFRSLAEDMSNRSICIVLSGTGSDGSLGLKAIKEVGGLAIVQDPQSAKYRGMPSNAIATEMVDFVLSPEQMPPQLIGYVQHSMRIEKVADAKPTKYDTEALQKIFIVLRSRTGHDFSQYKKNTILRRIERRMAVNQIETFKDYLHYLRQNTLEVDTLFKDLLIGVTRFFRDEQAFQVLEEEVIPHIFENRPIDEDVRVWVCGCSTGEEAYSVAILFREYMIQNDIRTHIQIFATDIDETSIEKARHGIYPDNIAADVPQKKLSRYFETEGNRYQVKPEIRDMVIFATQNVANDPPFSRLDLISCRNLLIYLDSELQRRVIPVFHYALRQDGTLFLGTSETLGEFHKLFHTVHRKHKIFRKINAGLDVQPIFRFPTNNSQSVPITNDGQSSSSINMKNVVESTLLREHVPVAILVNERAEILYTHGRTGKYLEIITGEPSSNVLKLAREGLKFPLTAAIRKVALHQERIVRQTLHVRTNGSVQPVRLVVEPLANPASIQGLILISIYDLDLPIQQDDTDKDEVDVEETPYDQQITELEQELSSTRQYLQTTIEELETSNEELTSTNEELQSSNEELQSTNEELETTKEELQSINEELMTVNTELESKISALSHANNDLNNLLASIGIAIVFLDMDLNIQRFNPAAATLINLIDSDIGRPISHIVNNFDYDNFRQDATQVLDSLESYELEVQTTNGSWFVMRMRPYRTLKNVIAGVIITFAEITSQKIVQKELSILNDLIEEAFTIVIITDPDGDISYVNAQYESLLGYSGAEILGQNIFFNKPKLDETFRQDLWDTVTDGRIWRGELISSTKSGTELYFRATVMPVLDQTGKPERYIVVKDDITLQKQQELEIGANASLYRMLARQLPRITVLVFNEEMRYLIAEGSDLERAGFVKSDIENRTFYEAVPEQLREALEPAHETALAGGQLQTEYISSTGERYQLLAEPLTLYEDGSEQGGIILLYRLDVS